MFEPTTLHTRRLTLTLPADADVDDIYSACQDAEIAKWTPLPSPYERSAAEWFVGFAAHSLDTEAGYHWAVRNKNEFVGMMSIERRAPGAGEIGYWLSPEARGCGYLVEAGAAALDFAFAVDGMQLDRVEWNAIVGNVPSARCAQKLGFLFEGTRRQSLATPRGRRDAWTAGLVFDDDRAETAWPVLP